MPSLQTHYHLNYISHSGPTFRRHQTPQGQSIAKPGFPLQNNSRESKHGIKESEGNMFNPIFTENVQGRQHLRSCAFVEPGWFSYRKPEHVVQNGKNGHKNSNHNHNYHDGYHDEI